MAARAREQGQGQGMAREFGRHLELQVGTRRLLQRVDEEVGIPDVQDQPRMVGPDVVQHGQHMLCIDRGVVGPREAE